MEKFKSSKRGTCVYVQVNIYKKRRHVVGSFIKKLLEIERRCKKNHLTFSPSPPLSPYFVRSKDFSHIKGTAEADI
jgi:hypothetical protein